MDAGILLVALIAVAMWIGMAWFWMWLARRQDRADPETWAQTLVMLLVGCGVALYAGMVNVTVLEFFFPGLELADLVRADGSITLASLVAVSVLPPILEESLKFAVLWLAVYSKPQFNQIADGVIFGIMVGLGFSIVENIDYMLASSQISAGSLLVTTVIRTVATTMLHITATGFAGYGLARAKFLGREAYAGVAFYLGVAILLHAIFNASVSFDYGILVGFSITLAALIYLFTLVHRPQNQLLWQRVMNAAAPAWWRQ